MTRMPAKHSFSRTESALRPGHPMRLLHCVLAAALIPAVAAAQGASPAAASEPHERLAFFEGLWSIDEVPPTREFRERCAWLEGGRRHMVCRSRSKSAAGEWREGLSMFSYQPADGSYVYYGLRPSGATQALVGGPTADRNGWEFRGEEGTGAARVRTHVQIMRLSDGRIRFTAQTASGDVPFDAADTVHYRAARPEPEAR